MRVLRVDDHRASQGLAAVLAAGPRIVPLATAFSEGERWPALQRTSRIWAYSTPYLPGAERPRNPAARHADDAAASGAALPTPTARPPWRRLEPGAKPTKRGTRAAST